MKRPEKRLLAVAVAAFVTFAAAALIVARRAPPARAHAPKAKPVHTARKAPSPVPQLDVADYDRRMKILAHVSTTTVAAATPVVTSTAPAKHARWPAKAPRPAAGAILPFHRVLAFYGNFHSKQMGIIGEFPEAEVLARLKTEVDRWAAADPSTPVMPAIHYVAVTAQGSPGGDGKYRLRMDDREIEKAIAMAHKAHGIAFVDIQVGLSNVQSEVPALDRFLKRPDVHLGLDPEFSMKGGLLPGKKIGTLDASEINWTIAHLSRIVQENGLPPKILVVHRFVKDMITNMAAIRPTPQVQVVINMDGWGKPDEKSDIYRLCITRHPVQFTGFKIFYRNDTRKPGSRLMTPEEVLKLLPQPIYIQYQ